MLRVTFILYISIPSRLATTVRVSIIIPRLAFAFNRMRLKGMVRQSVFPTWRHRLWNHYRWSRGYGVRVVFVFLSHKQHEDGCRTVQACFKNGGLSRKYYRNGQTPFSFFFFSKLIIIQPSFLHVAFQSGRKDVFNRCLYHGFALMGGNHMHPHACCPFF